MLCVVRGLMGPFQPPPPPMSRRRGRRSAPRPPSHLAIMERRKHSYRYRMVQDGSVIALFHTKADLEDALANPSAPPSPRRRGLGRLNCLRF